MREQIYKDKEFCILSRSIDNASKCRVTEVREDCFKIKLDNIYKYETDESVELFTSTPKGQLYFETIVKEVKDDILSVWFPIAYKYLQRREYSRIQLEKEVILKSDSSKINAKIVDISAGGLKLSTEEQLKLLTEYNINFDIENKSIKCVFEPIRIEAINDKYVSSGRFKGITNFDRIALVQFCFRKQIENSNK